MAKGLGLLPSESFSAAAEAFKRLYPHYAPGRGIQIFLN